MEEKGAVCGTAYPGICFETVSSRGQLSTCDHLFHYRCILQWSKVPLTQIANLCPTCRVPFPEIRMYRKGLIVKTVAVERPQNPSSEEDVEPESSASESEDWQNRCQICEDDNPAGLMLCDGEDGECTNAYHYRCVGLTAPPRGKWLCAECQSLEEFKNAHPEEFALCQSSEEDSEFSDPGEESSEEDSDLDASFEEVDSTEAHSKPQSFVISDEQSDPEGQYDPPDESSCSSSSSEEAPPPPPKRVIRPRTRQPRRNVRSMNETQRKKYIRKNLDPDFTPEDPIDQAWLIYRNLRHPNKRPCEHEEPKSAAETQTSSDFKEFVTTLVRREVGEHLVTQGLAGKVHQRRTVSK